MHKVDHPDALRIVRELKTATDYDNATPDIKTRIHFYVKACVCVGLFEAVDQEMPLTDVSLLELGACLTKFYTALTPNLSNVMRFQWLPTLLFPPELGNFPTALTRHEHAGLVQMIEVIRKSPETSPEQHAYWDKFIAGEMPPGVLLEDQ